MEDIGFQMLGSKCKTSKNKKNKNWRGKNVFNTNRVLIG